MIDLKKALVFIKNVKDRCKKYCDFSLEEGNKHKKDLELASKELGQIKNDLSKGLENYYNENFLSLINQVDDLLDVLKADYSDEYERGLKLSKKYSFKEIGPAKEELLSELNIFNDLASEIEKTDYNGKASPRKITIDGEKVISTDEDGIVEIYEFDSKKISHKTPCVLNKELVIKACQFGTNIKNVIKSIYSLFEESIEINSFNENETKIYDNYVAELNSNYESNMTNKFFEIFNSKEATDVYENYFDEIDALERVSTPNIETGSDKFKESITIGEIQLNVCSDSKYLGYLKETSILKDRIDAKGNIPFPLIAYLKDKGNIFINTNEESYSKTTKEFINQLIIGFSLSFPSSRIHFKFVDIANKMGFSSLIAFQKVNSNIFLDGIIRDDRALDDAIKSVKNLKLNAEDKLNLDAMPNIYEYNKKLDSAPMDVYLFVLVDFPSKLTASNANDIKNIVCDGKDYGVFSIIINNDDIPLEYNFENSEYEKICNQIQDTAYVFECNGSSITYTPNDSSRKTYSVKPLSEVSTLNLAKIIEVLSVNAHTELSKPIPLTKMYEYIDSSKKQDISVDFDIPFGMSGADIISMSLGKYPHAAVIGGTGSGKSIFFHTLILDACYRFSPEELNFYLLDFKGGIEFSYYEEFKLPHIKLIGLTQDLNDGLSILVNLRNEMHNRMTIFKEAGADNIESYYKKRNKGKIARLFVIIDEIQEIFREDSICEKALNILSEILALGRACGINVLWGSQSVPSVSGIDNKLMQNIATRICLKVENTDYAMRLFSDGISLKPVIDIKNKPEKGYGVISDSTTGSTLKEFRVAYSEDRDNREKYYQEIIKKWSSLNAKDDLYVIGDDMMPNMKEDNNFKYDSLRDVKRSKLSESYKLILGTNYVSGKSLSLNIKLLQERENLMFIGTDGSLLRDLMGFSLLSVINNRSSDLDCINASENYIYYVNKEGTIDPKLALDLYNVLPKEEKAKINNVSSPDKFKQALKEIYSIYQERERTIENGDSISDASSYFIFIHYLQYFDDMISKNEPLEEAGFSWDGSSNDSVKIGDALKTLIQKGGKYGIHFVVSINSASTDCLYSIKNELNQFSHKVSIKGSDVRNMVSINPSQITSINSDRICLLVEDNELVKFRPYRYEESNSADEKWFKEVFNSYNKN